MVLSPLRLSRSNPRQPLRPGAPAERRRSLEPVCRRPETRSAPDGEAGDLAFEGHRRLLLLSMPKRVFLTDQLIIKRAASRLPRQHP